MSRNRHHRHSFLHRVAVGALTLIGSALLGVVVGVSDPSRQDRTDR